MDAEPVVKRRGRPPGAKNRPKVDIEPGAIHVVEAPVPRASIKSVTVVENKPSPAPVLPVKRRGRPPGAKSKHKEEEETPRVVAADTAYIEAKLHPPEVPIKLNPAPAKALKAKVIPTIGGAVTKVLDADEIIAELSEPELEMFVDSMAPIVAAMGKEKLVKLKEVEAPSIEHAVASLIVMYFNLDLDTLKQQFE